ncbi:helix-turn-helix transcriptional regulator [Clostridium sp. LY3-2]|uniref:helix-turn-helix domain-containing protein n=1 Tax=Clostridium sp. LY3-2 TaxID=2942482 RepID=UPI0021520855|nr:helix-turn-helix transcriptional regulator [Clostridium sp. LY3-2]MCR6515335.1 helix-turn-helix transcriptional regulator [Clostridium sp. LY3-2]
MNKPIKKYIAENKIGIVGFAKKADICKSAISDLVNDKRDFRKMTVENAYKISKAMNSSINNIYEEEENL